MKTVIEMAREAGIRDCTCNGTLGCLERFAELIRADEREACAKVCDETAKKAFALQSGFEDDLANVFLRHHAVAHQSDAAAIRARSKT